MTYLRNLNAVRLMLALAMMAVSYTAYVLPTSAANLIIVIIIALSMGLLYRHEYSDRHSAFIAMIAAFAIGAVIAYVITGPPPA